MKRERKYFYKKRNNAIHFQFDKASQFYNRLKGLVTKRRLGVACGSITAVFLFSAFAVFPFSTERLVDIDSHEEEFSLQFIAEYYQMDYSGVGSGGDMEQEIEMFKEFAYTTYTIQPGDTLEGIGRDNKVSLDTLISYNNIKDCRRLIPGTDLRIPNLDGVLHKIKKGDTLESIAKQYDVNINNIIDSNNLESEVLAVGNQIFVPGGKLSEYELKKAIGNLVIWPCTGRLTSYFGYRADPFTGKRSFHTGIDIANYRGAPIRAAMSGKVVLNDYRPRGYGRYVVIQHSNGLKTLYGHLNKSFVRSGQWVEQGQLIGEMGTTGYSTGNHLHFTIYEHGRLVNPFNYLSGNR